MPDRGLLQRDRITAGPADPHDEGASWALDGVNLAQVTFEVNREAALSVMPCEVSRPVPCYGRLIVLDARESPAGALRLAVLAVGGRHNMMPRNVLVDCIVDGDLATVRRAFGGPFRSGSVHLARDGKQVTAAVYGAEGLLARMALPALRAVDRAMLRWDPWLGYGDIDGSIELLDYGLRPSATDAFLSKDATVDTAPELPRAHPWRRLRNLNTISACYLEGATELTLPQPQRPIA